MANPYSTVAAASRLADLPERLRRRRLENEDRELALADRDRQIVREQEADARERTRFERQQADWRYEDTQRALRDAEHREDRARELRLRDRSDLEHAEDRAYTKSRRQFELGRLREQAKRSDAEWARNQDALRRKLRDEGMERMIRALEQNVDPRLIEREFNSSGELGIKPGTLHYDSISNRVAFVDSDGEEFEGTLDDLKALFMEPKAAEPIKLGANDRLVDPSSGEVLIGPERGGAGFGGSGFTKWNPQTASDKAADVVRRGLGLTFDSKLNRWMIPRGMSTKVVFGESLAAKVVREFGQSILPEEAGAIAFEAVRLVPTYEEAVNQATKEGYAGNEQQLNQRAQQIIEAGRRKAAQMLNRLMDEKRREVELKEQEGVDGQTAPPANRPPLSSFHLD